MRYMRNDAFEEPLGFLNSGDRFLVKIAQQVEELIIEDSSKLNYIREQVCIFVEECEILLDKRTENNQDVPINPPFLLAPIVQGEWPEDWQPQNEKDLLPDYCFLLTLIHDAMLPSPRFVPINNGIFKWDDQWVQSCWDYYRVLREGDTSTALIEKALKSVKADLSSIKTDEKKQVVASTIQSKIVSLLWRLYETTLKVLVDAFLERFWPKPK